MLSGVLGFVSGIIKPATELIDNLTTTKEEKLELKARMMEIENALTAKLIDLETRTIEAKEKIMVAELQQTDNYTKRARPTIIYGGLAILALNHVLLPWAAWFGIHIFSKAINLPSITLPSEFWIAWGGVCGVYAFGRSKEKLAGVK